MLIFKQMFLECIEQQGMNLSTVATNPMFDIIFINNEGKVDETQLTIEGKHDMAVCRVLLDELFSDFCKENGFDRRKGTVKEVVFKGLDPYYDSAGDKEAPGNNLFKELVYELYKQHWVDTHTSADERLAARREYVQDCIFEEEFCSFATWNEEHGYGGMIYACFDEFCKTEYQDAEYICELLKDEKLKELYYKDIE